MVEDSEGIARCPGCSDFYDMKYPASMFEIGMIEPEDSTCREAGYVHVHWG